LLAYGENLQRVLRKTRKAMLRILAASFFFMKTFTN
jgi:hypothetical protein